MVDDGGVRIILVAHQHGHETYVSVAEQDQTGKVSSTKRSILEITAST